VKKIWLTCKSLRTTTLTTTDAKWLQYITWPFGSGEVKSYFRLTNFYLLRIFRWSWSHDQSTRASTVKRKNKKSWRAIAYGSASKAVLHYIIGCWRYNAVRVVVRKLLHVNRLLWNHWGYWNKTLLGCSLDGSLKSLWGFFVDRKYTKNKMLECAKKSVICF
jgi:hypothetical protein